ncbi:MAG: hypothetical protein SPL00_05120 [Bacilli bacterium]|nr:hypothetical protein [Bacilli bacterium]
MNKESFKLFDYVGYLLKKYKYMGISEDELVVLILIFDLLNDRNKLITPDILALRMTKKKTEIQKILNSLLEKKFIVYENSKKGLKTSIDPLKKKLLKRYSLEINRSDEENEERAEIISNLEDFFQEKLNRKLLPIEFEQLNVWLDSCYSEEEIKNAALDCFKEKKTAFYYFNLKLLEYRTKNDLEKEGISPSSQSWNKDFDETMAIIKAKWVEPDE